MQLSTDQLREVVWTPEMIARFWGHMGTQHEDYFTFQVGRSLIRHFRKHLKPSARILDYGAGPGFLIDDLLRHGYSCGAVEISDDAVTQLNRRFASHPKFLGAHTVEEAARGQFDAIFLIEVIEHLYDDALAVCVANARQFLAPGGVLILTTPNDEDRGKSMIVSPETGRLFHRMQHVRSWTADTLSAKLRTHDLLPVEIGVTDFGAAVTALQRTHGLSFRLARSAAKRLLGWSRKPPHLYAVATA